ncbi:DUF3375 domain-containing protein [Thermogemmatispora tikiterensis]|uniref:DUF3375 domain-containing protein n=1 Tax=Thermogemmatispora tikiterensis TaxID=1825093 RepID=A0A328VDZ4_9CHLR|nr:DUF3375 domain-containing protein [Thermogemmatispora tikiterensis]RAQ93970.1 hypothetical protein A4R35_00400 [Thermogemmatispora tikiterensis]
MQDFTQYDYLECILQESPGIRLLKATNASMIISFFFSIFRKDMCSSVPLSVFLERLEAHLQELNARRPGSYTRSAQAYLNEWCDEEHRFLQVRRGDGKGEHRVELTAETERTLSWLETLEELPFIGTESRFLQIIRLLREMDEQSMTDPQARIARLEEQRREIEQQIARISQSGSVPVLDDWQIVERFLEVRRMARELLHDFRRVEEVFRKLADSITQASLEQEVHKGQLIHHVLDADQALKSSEQGQSFYSFWGFISQPWWYKELYRLIERMLSLEAVTPRCREDHLLRRLPMALFEAGWSIVLSNYQLAESLRRLLDEQIREEQRRLEELLIAIKRQTLVLKDSLPLDEPLLELEGSPQVYLPLERGFWQPAEEPLLCAGSLAVEGHEPDAADLNALFSGVHVDESLLRGRLRKILQEVPAITLAELLVRYPPEAGLAELLVYLAIAASEPAHLIDPTSYDLIVLPSPCAGLACGASRCWLVPRVLYQRAEG